MTEQETNVLQHLREKLKDPQFKAEWDKLGAAKLGAPRCPGCGKFVKREDIARRNCAWNHCGDCCGCDWQ